MKQFLRFISAAVLLSSLAVFATETGGSKNSAKREAFRKLAQTPANLFAIDGENILNLSIKTSSDCKSGYYVESNLQGHGSAEFCVQLDGGFHAGPRLTQSMKEDGRNSRLLRSYPDYGEVMAMGYFKKGIFYLTSAEIVGD